jgi:hypothetical protein
LLAEGIEAACCDPGLVSGGGVQKHIDPYITRVLSRGNVICIRKHVYTLHMYCKLILKLKIIQPSDRFYSGLEYGM